jgi:hypothetical protein
MSTATFEQVNTLVEEIANEEFLDDLAHYIRQRYNEAFQHRINTGYENRLMRNLRVKKAQYQPDEIAMLGGIDVYIGLSALKSRAAESWLLDVLLNTLQKPWSIDPTPIPNLPDDVKEQAIDLLSQELDQFQTMDEVRQRASDLKKSVLEYLQKQAKTACQGMEEVIEDQFDEGCWTKAFQRFLEDLCTFPRAILRGPVVMQRRRATWKGNKVASEYVGVPEVRCISPFDAYPSPTSSTEQDGDYFIERARFSRAKLYELKDIETFDEVNVRLALDAYPNGYELMLNHDAERDRLEGKEPDITNPTRLLDVIIFNGVLPGKFLIDKGVLVEDPQKHYEAEVWVCGNYTLRAVLNPNPLGKRPLHGTSFAKRNDSYWGDDPISLTYDIQRIVNSLCRAMVRNAAYASGPIAEVVAERMTAGESITQIDPYRMYFVGPDMTGSGQRAITFNQVPDVSGPLMGNIEKFMKMADDISGIPAYVIGSPQVAGAGRTLGGLSMLMGNAAKGIKQVMLNIDTDVIGEVVESFYYYNLVTHPDTSIKADAKIVASGTTGLLQRELQQNKITELLQLLTPYAQNNIIAPPAIQYLIRQIVMDSGLDADKIMPDPDAQAQQEAEARQATIQQAAGGPPGGSPPKPNPPDMTGVQGAISSGAGGPPPAAAPPQAQAA